MIISQLPIGAKVREEKSGVVFLIADKNHTGYAGAALISDCAIKLAAFDAAEPDNPDGEARENGSGYYPDSNIHHWLNSNDENWYVPAHEFDAPPTRENTDQGRLDPYDVPFYSQDAMYLGDYSYADEPGFLTRFSEGFTGSLLEVRIPCFIEKEQKPYGPPEPVYAACKVFLLSGAEIGFEFTSLCTEGFRYGLFADGRMRVCAPSPAAIKRESGYVYDGCAFYYWLRSPIAGKRGFAAIYNSDHKMGDNNRNPVSPLPARSICGIRPATNIRPDVQISEKPDKSGVFSLIF